MMVGPCLSVSSIHTAYHITTSVNIGSTSLKEQQHNSERTISLRFSLHHIHRSTNKSILDLTKKYHTYHNIEE